MKTTEIFAEQVLIGLLVILMIALVFWIPLKSLYLNHATSPGLLAQVIAGGLLLGTAYVIGIVYDRVADTLLQDLESHGRLHFALEPFKARDSKRFVMPIQISFEDGKYRILILSNSQATAYMDYLRSRIRLTRALATLVPGIMVSILLVSDDGRAGRWWYIAAGAIPFVYAIALYLKGLKCDWIKRFRPPKTYDLAKLAKYMERGRMLVNCGNGRPHSVKWFAIQDELWGELLLIALVAATLTSGSYGRKSVVVAGLLLTLIVGWAWWRVSRTFYAFLRDYARYGYKEPKQPQLSTKATPDSKAFIPRRTSPWLRQPL